MAAGIDLASGVFASVSIALQLAEAALKLHRFWNRVQDAPKEMQDILNDLLTLKDVLRDIHVQQALIKGPPEALPTHRPLLKCGEYFEELETLAKKLQLDFNKGVVYRKWKSIKVVFRKDQVIQLRANIESMKITLVLARQSLETMIAEQQNTVFACDLASLSTAQAENTKALRSMEETLSHETKLIIETLQMSNNAAATGLLMKALESTIKSCVRQGVEESFQELQSKMLSANIVSDWDANDAEFELVEDTQQFPFPSNAAETSEKFPPYNTASGEFPRRRSLTHYNRAFRRKRYDTWFGRIQVDVLVAAKLVKEEKYGTEISRVERLYKFTFTFKPSTWLFRPGLWRLSLQQQSADADHRFNIRPSYSPIVPHDAPIFQLCQDGNVPGVVGLLEGRQASVYDIDSWGRGLLHMAARSQSPELIKYLLDAGCVRGSVDEYGNSPLDLLPFFQRGSGTVLAENALMDVVRLLIEEADCATNFTEISNRCCNNFLQNLCKYRRVLDLAELTPIIHYLLTRESFWIELNPVKESDKYKNFNPLSDMLYNEEKEETIISMSTLARQHSVDVTAIAEFGYSTMQDALMQEHDMAVIVSLVKAGAWLHTKNTEAQTPCRVSWWRRADGQAGVPFALYKKCNPPTDRFEIYEFLLYGESPFSEALQECQIDLWEFATNEAIVVASEDPDEPLQYLTAPCYHRVSVDSPIEVLLPKHPGPLPYRRKSHTSDPD